MYFANPGPASRVAMRAGLIGAIGTPAQSHRLDPGVTWCADNGAFSERWDAGKWWAWLERNAVNAGTCWLRGVNDQSVLDFEASV